MGRLLISMPFSEAVNATNAAFYMSLKTSIHALLHNEKDRKGFSDRGIHPFTPDIVTDEIWDKYSSDDEDVLQINDGNIPVRLLLLLFHRILLISLKTY